MNVSKEHKKLLTNVNIIFQIIANTLIFLMKRHSRSPNGLTLCSLIMTAANFIDVTQRRGETERLSGDVINTSKNAEHPLLLKRLAIDNESNSSDVINMCQALKHG